MYDFSALADYKGWQDRYNRLIFKDRISWCNRQALATLPALTKGGIREEAGSLSGRICRCGLVGTSLN